MKPCTRAVLPSSQLLQTITIGPVVASVKGSVKKLGEQYKDAIVILYNKSNFQPLAVRKPSENGNYSFLGINTNLKTFIVALDKNQQFNAVIQDNVVPK